MTENNETRQKRPVLKPSQADPKRTYSLVSAGTQEGKFGPQLAGMLASGERVFLPMTNGVAKAIVSGKLKLPVSLAASRRFSEKFTDDREVVTWTLATKRTD